MLERFYGFCMKHILIAMVLFASVVIAQTIVDEHEQYLVDMQRKQFLGIPSEVMLQEACSHGNDIEMSVKIVENKFSVLAIIEGQKLYQEGVVSLNKKPEIVATTKLLQGKEFKFAMSFMISAEKSCVEVTGNYAEILPKEPVDTILMYAGMKVYGVAKENLNTTNYKPFIQTFICGERAIFLLGHEEELQSERGFDCPKCGYPLYKYAHYCYSCNKCFSGGSLKCTNCWSSNWTNGKICSQCGNCYR